jgi:hypothetical protein
LSGAFLAFVCFEGETFILPTGSRPSDDKPHATPNRSKSIRKAQATY